MLYDVIIIGKGPAGISASLYTVRARIRTLVIGRGDSALRKAEKIDNYYGFSRTVNGKELLEQGEMQALRLGAELIDDEVVTISKDDFFHISTAKSEYSCKAVLMATGQPQKRIMIENLERLEGKGISYCSTCDGFFYNNMKVGVLGNKDFAVHEASELLAYTQDLTIFTNGSELEITPRYSEAAQRFAVNKRVIIKVDGAEFLQRIFFDDGTSEELDGLFIANESASSIDFARKLGILVDGNSVVVDKNQQTNLDGLFAAGDCTGGFKQVSTAVGQGALAGRKIIEYVKSL